MSADQVPGLETTARITQLIDDAPSIERTTPQQEATKIRENMRATKEGMEKARDHLGNYCVTIGNDGEGGRSKVVVLTEPVAGLEYQIGSLNYAVVTDEGVRFIRWYPKEVEDPKSGDQKQLKNQLDQFKQKVEEAIQGNGVIAEDNNAGYDRGFGAGAIQIGPDFHGVRLQLDISPHEGKLAEQAVQASLEAARTRNQELLTKTARTLEPAESIQKQLGIEPVKNPEATQTSGWRKWIKR